MRVLYLIFSHDNFEQLHRLVRTIRHLSPDSTVAIHHDPAKFRLEATDFLGIDGVHVIPNPIHGEWGDYSLVEQYIHGLRWCDDHLPFDWLITITGLSYPIRPLQDFEAMLAASEFDAYVYHFDAFDPTHWPLGTATTRYLFRYFKLPRCAYYYKIPSVLRRFQSGLRVWLNGSQALIRIVPMPRGARTRIGIRRLSLPRGYLSRLFGGRQMLNVNRKACTRLLHFLDRTPSWPRYFKRTLIPDEVFFNSILANDPELRICNNALRYIKWPKEHASSVGVITIDDLPNLQSTEAPFALKLDCLIDAQVLDAIDRRLGLSTQDETC